ncbi:hypothetical protein BU16DRAFT_204374 [Lophium mytilinum]|uniref:Uncharacterized protein n=1 Tax=Lophium mytilinum TaxID=390894 RepID=A0A6A6R9Y6_9PEZI|nr:hypothetical protein BU16DRAFT_204374 [Lophium mytilinum]
MAIICRCATTNLKEMASIMRQTENMNLLRERWPIPSYPEHPTGCAGSNIRLAEADGQRRRPACRGCHRRVELIAVRHAGGWLGTNAEEGPHDRHCETTSDDRRSCCCSAPPERAFWLDRPLLLLVWYELVMRDQRREHGKRQATSFDGLWR